MCYTLNSLLNRMGETTAAGGAKVGGFVALGLVAGVIIGGWRKKTDALPA